MKENQRVIITTLYSPYCGKKARLIRKRKNKRFGQKTWYIEFEKPVIVHGAVIKQMQIAERNLAVIPEDYAMVYQN